MSTRPATAVPDDPLDPSWVSRQVDAMADAWDRGDRLTADAILARHPGLASEPAIRLIYEEVCLRREAGLGVDSAEVVGRYPRWARELRALFDCDRWLRPSTGGVGFPEPGETLGPFRLLDELGRGAAGRTYLAADPGLADRPVVVKVIPDDQEEHLALARLRHTHIVPLFSEHAFEDRGLRALCMPYLGGATLAKLLKDMAGVDPADRSGRLLVEWIDRHARESPDPVDAPFRRALEAASYVQAVVWVGACLADALHYAHARGLVHMDVKPSNVLITADGQPMLLDFHLARAPAAAGETVDDRLGGTPGWMSPEQAAAMEDVQLGRPLAHAVDARTDVYALGLLIREALATSGSARSRADARELGRENPAVSPGLVDVVRKCLAPEPADRYADAASLADDLRRHLNDQPLRGVRNRSPVERWRKWRRRHPGSFGWAAAGLSAVLLAASAFAAHRAQVQTLRSAVDDGRRAREAGRYDEAVRTLERVRDRAGALPFAGDLARTAVAEIRRADRGRLAAELHELADLVRFRYGVDLPPGDEAEALARQCRAVWDQRQRLTDPAATGSKAGRRVETDLLELAVVWADLRDHLATPAGRAAARQEALRMLDEADRAYGPSLAVDLRRGSPERAPGARSAWEFYDLGRFLVRNGRFDEADAAFRKALDLRPQDVWPNFYQGLCAFRLGRFADAASAFRACVALAPRSAACRYNRALAYDAMGRTADASADYDAALERDPALAEAWLNRGVLAVKAGRPRDAIPDFDRGLAARPGRATRGRLHYNRALALRALGDRAPALADAREAARLGCDDAALILDPKN